MRISIYAVITIAALSIVPINAHPAPANLSASGTFSTGSSVIITGTGFLNKIPAAPLLWAPFTSSIQPSSLGRLTSWSGDGGSGCEVWANNIGWSGGGVRTNPASCINSSSTVMELVASFSGLSVQINALGGSFYSFRRRNLTEDNTAGNGNIKNWMIEHFNAYGDGEVILTHSADNGDSFNGQNMSPSSYYYTDQGGLGWKAEEVIAKVASSVNQNPEVFTFVSNGNTVSTISGKDLGINSGNVIDTVVPVFHGHFSSSGAQELAYFDDVYFDNTWSRVMVGNASTLAASTHREIAVPTAWSDTSITVSFNQGTFTNGQTAYLYVIDSTGAVNSAGYAIEIEGAGSNVTCYPDIDEDTYGDSSDAGEVRTACEAGEVTDHTDCNDTNSAIHPGATDVCGNSVDEDCSGSDASCASATGHLRTSTGAPLRAYGGGHIGVAE